MTLHLIDPEIDRLAQALAAATGEDVVEAVRKALTERLERMPAKQPIAEGLAARLMEIGRHFSSSPDLDLRSADEIIGYDESGLW